MKIHIYLILMLITTAFSNAFADNTNDTSTTCNAEISMRLKEPTIVVKTNQPVIVLIQMKNVSTNATLIYWLWMGNTIQDFTWKITSPSGKDLSPKPDALHEPFSGAYCKIPPMESREQEYDLSSACNFSEAGTYKIVAQKQVVSFLSATNRTSGEIISSPVNIIISKQ